MLPESCAALLSIGLSLVVAPASTQDPAAGPSQTGVPIAPDGPAPEAGMAPAQVDSTPAVQRPSDDPSEAGMGREAGDGSTPALGVDPNPEPLGAGDDPNPAATQPGSEHAGVATSQQLPADDPARAQDIPAPATVPGEPRPGVEGPEQDESRRDKRRRKPFLYNPLWLSVGLGGSFWGGGRGALNFGVDATYFFIPWVGAGLEVSDTVFLGAPADEVSNIVRITPSMTVLMAPRARVSPYVKAGLGPVIYNRGVGALGRWVGGGGIVMRFTRAFVNLGVDVSGQFPDEKYRDLVGDNCLISQSLCSLNITPRIGAGFALGRRRG